MEMLEVSTQNSIYGARLLLHKKWRYATLCAPFAQEQGKSTEFHSSNATEKNHQITSIERLKEPTKICCDVKVKTDKKILETRKTKNAHAKKKCHQ